MQWYYVNEGQRLGPITEAKLNALHQDGKINTETLIWKEGQAEWTAYGTVFASTGAAVATAVAAPSGLTCVSCHKPVTTEDAVQLSGNWVCAACKPDYVQRLREGVTVSQEFRYAGFWIRFAAKIVDGIILMLVTIPLNILAGGYMAPAGGPPTGKGLAIYLLIQLVVIAITMSYSVFFVGKYGATPGKMVCGLKIVRADGSKLTYGRAVGRFFGVGLSYLTFYIGFIMAGFDVEKRALHDRVCDTRVVYKNK